MRDGWTKNEGPSCVTKWLLAHFLALPGSAWVQIELEPSVDVVDVSADRLRCVVDRFQPTVRGLEVPVLPELPA